MPKQIKKEVLKPGEMAYRVTAVIVMFLATGLAALLVFMLPRLLEDESAVKACIITGVYALFTIGCIVHCAIALINYPKEPENASALIQGILSLAASFMCLLNLRFMLAMFFSGLDMQAQADKVIGDHTMSEFVNMQTSNWTCLIFAMAIMLLIGILSVVRLAKR